MSDATSVNAGAGLDRQVEAGVARLWLDRPGRRNAFDPPLIAALIDAVTALGADPRVRVIVLGGRGSAFCAGADLEWMARLAQLPLDANRDDARQLARLFATLDACPKPTVARVHGACFGGGIGLVAACDLARGGRTVRQFAFSEVRIGLLPATIGPYALRAMGHRAASRYMLTAETLRCGRCRADRARAVSRSRPANSIRPSTRCSRRCSPAARRPSPASSDCCATSRGAPIDEPVVRDTACADRGGACLGRRARGAGRGARQAPARLGAASTPPTAAQPRPRRDVPGRASHRDAAAPPADRESRRDRLPHRAHRAPPRRRHRRSVLRRRRGRARTSRACDEAVRIGGPAPLDSYLKHRGDHRGGAAQRRRCGASGLRLPVGERRASRRPARRPAWSSSGLRRRRSARWARSRRPGRWMAAGRRAADARLSRRRTRTRRCCSRRPSDSATRC